MLRDCTRIALDRDLCILFHRKIVIYRLHDCLHIVFLQPGRGTAADKNRRDPAIFILCSVKSKFLLQCRHVTLLRLLVCRKRKEIAVITFFHTKWNMNI